MFREIRRFKQALSEEKCKEILENEKRGVLSVLGDNDYPYGLPINHYYDKENHRLFFHGGKSGHRVDAVNKHNNVSFCVYDQGYRKEGDWALNISSVIVFGKLIPVEDQELAMKLCRDLCYKFTQDQDYIEHEIQSSGKNTLVYELVIEHMSGKLVNEA